MPASDTHHEIHLEDYIETQLINAGWYSGSYKDYDADRALYPEDVIAWVKESQPETWAKLEKLGNGETPKRLMDRLVKELQSKGTVEVLRQGIKMAGAGAISMSQAKPEDARNKTVVGRYKANRLRVVRQLRYNPTREWSIDMVFFINGIPVATCELKTDFTQSIEHAVNQYKFDRNPKDKATGRNEPLLSWKRSAVVHFAVSDSEIQMTTKLDGGGTRFLPFNRGSEDGGAGNPSVKDGYPISYFWERVLQPDNWLRVFHRFVYNSKQEIEDSKGRVQIKETTIFPRFHQWEGVTELIDTVTEEKAGHQYLFEHSAGSGKTNTIAWTSHELIRLREANGDPYFHSVIVVTDRTVLDAQLQEAIQQIEHRTGVVKAIDRDSSNKPKSQQLAEALLAGVPIIVVTIQTFPFAMEAILTEKSLKDRRFAVIIDEAHTSQTGKTATKLRALLTLDKDEDMDKMTADEILTKLQEVRGMPKNVSHFAFTATPKHPTYMLFGRPKDPKQPKSKSNPPVAFHTYSMRQAIEEGFILDVLQNYTSYKVALRMGETVKDDKRVDSKTARRALARWLSLHPTNVGQKVEFIIEHFRTNISHLLGGQAKAMVVTSSRAAAVKYMLAFNKYVRDHEYRDVRALIAFSGTVNGKSVDTTLDGEEFTEKNMNPDAKGRDLRKVFDSEEYRVMLVANKFQTGFDQPKLVAMYVDKKVSGVEAVQTLSRLNRTFPGKDRTYVIDFVNEPEEIVAAFRQFYNLATISDIQDPDIVYDIKQRLDDAMIYEQEDVDLFGAEIGKLKPSHKKLHSLTQPATDRFNVRLKEINEDITLWEKEAQKAEALGDKKGADTAETHRAEAAKKRDELIQFKERLGKFVRTYEYIAQLINFDDPDLESFAGYARLLKNRLKGMAKEEVDLGGLKMTHYALKRGKDAEPIAVGEGKPLQPYGGNEEKKPQDRRRSFLSELIEKLNELFGEGITEKDKIVFAVHISEKLRENEVVMDQVRNNSREQALRADLPKAASDAIVEALTSHETIAGRLLSDEQTRKIFEGILYDMLRNGKNEELLEAKNIA
jgi:type I restriction enzyme R subunit